MAAHPRLPRAAISIPNQINVLFCVQIVELRSKPSQSLNLLLLEEQRKQLQAIRLLLDNLEDGGGQVVDI